MTFELCPGTSHNLAKPSPLLKLSFEVFVSKHSFEVFVSKHFFEWHVSSHILNFAGK
jgi:hypothetical protein